jgi:hypothetical protein
MVEFKTDFFDILLFSGFKGVAAGKWPLVCWPVVLILKGALFILRYLTFTDIPVIAVVFRMYRYFL